ncbi:MAG: UDP-N-acetyl-D-mannosamine dehydrogenase [Hyphomicrobiaceae bacterium]
MSRVCVVGLGYIGLPTAAMLASAGHTVIGFDVNPDVVAKVNQGLAHFREPDLEMLLAAAVKTGRLTAQMTPAEADYYIIAVPTPFKNGKRPDLSYVDAGTDSIAPYLRPGCTIILESTSPVGTTERIATRLAEKRKDLVFPSYKNEDHHDGQVYVVHCPERILPGQMVRELVANDRIIGGMTEFCVAKANSLYESFVKGTSYTTDCRTAEFVKLMENAYRDVNIAFANEVSLICDRLDVDVWQAIDLANKHPRVSVLKPGPGVGGHCIAVDPWFIVDSAPEQSRLIKTAREINDQKTDYVYDRIVQAASRFRNPVIACFGVTYKPDVDDLRESPALHIVERLLKNSKFKVLVCDPMLKDLPQKIASHPRLKVVDAEAARAEADIVTFLVGHKKFRNLQPQKFLEKVVVDTIGLMSVTPSAQ